MNKNLEINFGYSLSERELIISQGEKEKNKQTGSFEFRGKITTFQLIDIPLEMPKYRLSNGRTKASQLEYIATNKKPSDFFDMKHTESEVQQAAQHQLLINEIGKENKNLENFFKSSPWNGYIIITRKGIVVNGNRRVAALRKMNSTYKSKGKKISHIPAAVLPECLESEILTLEDRLQADVDIKQDYDWCADAILIRERVNKIGSKAVAASRRKSEKDIQEKINVLEIGEKYLEFFGNKHLYSLIRKAEYACEAVLFCRLKLKNSRYLDYLEPAAFLLMKSKGGDSNYKQIKKLANESILIKVHNKEKGSRIVPAKSKKKVNKRNPFAITNDKKSAVFMADKFIKKVKASKDEKIDEIADDLKEDISSYDEKTKVNQRISEFKDSISKANAILKSAFNIKHSKSDVTGCKELIKEIFKTAKQISKCI